MGKRSRTPWNPQREQLSKGEAYFGLRFDETVPRDGEFRAAGVRDSWSMALAVRKKREADDGTFAFSF